MKWIDYESPKSLDEAAGLLSQNPGKARMLAGGTDLLVDLRGGRHLIDLVVDGKEIPELTGVEWDSQSGLTIGAATPCYKIYGSDIVQDRYPGLVDSASLIGGTQIQGRASFGGNLCNAAPSGDSIPAMIVHNATATIFGPNGSREVAVEDFCTGPRQTILAADEILVSIHFPPPTKGFGANYLRFIPRNEMDIAVAGVGVSISLQDGIIKTARLSLASVAPTPLLVQKAAQALEGNQATKEVIQAAADAARDAAVPITDMRGTIEYRKHLCEVLTRRALNAAIERAKENQ